MEFTAPDAAPSSSRSHRESFDVTEFFSEHERHEFIKVLHHGGGEDEPPRRPPIEAVPSAPSSYGSSGSAFLSSLLNHSNNTTTSAPQHTPPYVDHGGKLLKRPRTGSVSGRLRSASEYLDERGLLDPRTKGIIKDLIIIGDEELQFALDNYEDYNNPSYLEQMIQNGALQNRLPQDLDLLGDLDLDFLTMDDAATGGSHPPPDHLLSSHPTQDDDNSGGLAYRDEPDDEDDDHGSYEEDDDAYHRALPPTIVEGAHQLQLLHQGPLSHKQLPNKVSPLYNEHADDGIGDLEFGDFASSSPGAAAEEDDHLRRLRSNSLFSALLNDPRSSETTAATTSQSRYATRQRSAALQQRDRAASIQSTTSSVDIGQWLDRSPLDGGGAAKERGQRKKSRELKPAAASLRGGPARRKSAPQPPPFVPPPVRSGLSLLLEADAKKREKEALKELKKKERLERKERKQAEKRKEEDEEKYQHVPGSGRPRSLSDPLLHYSLDAQGLQQCDRPDGWIGAYSPSSRRVRIARFLEKRSARVWTKSVKYDVRKNFADSRLRVKGRFVKKEEESLMRELMSLT